TAPARPSSPPSANPNWPFMIAVIRPRVARTTFRDHGGPPRTAWEGRAGSRPRVSRCQVPAGRRPVKPAALIPAHPKLVFQLRPNTAERDLDRFAAGFCGKPTTIMQSDPYGRPERHFGSASTGPFMIAVIRPRIARTTFRDHGG